MNNNNYPEKEMARMLESFTPAMWSEIRHLADALELVSFGISGQTDWRELPPLPRPVLTTVIDKLDEMMRRLLANHGRLDLVPQWQSVREAILPPMTEPSLPVAEDDRRRPRERLCENRAPRRER
jgi:hypothetical protein